MARKSSSFKELLAEKRAVQDKFKMVERIKQKAQSGDYGEQVKDVIIDPEGHEKMSDVLDEFIEPYLATVKNIPDYKTLLMMGTIAWNASVVPEDKQEKVLKLMTNELLANSPVDIWEDTLSIINKLVARKKKYFASIKRYVVDYTVRDTGRDYHLSVVSSLIDTEDSEN
ncbi:MAG: hypothetical protein AAF757_00300 [Cyanobacteria bacterium P01_D01_bin.116]